MGGGKDAAKDAAKAQMAMLQKQIDEQRAAYKDTKKLYAPYQEAGLGGLQSYLALLGQSGDQAQQEAIAGLEQTPGYQAQLQAGQRTMLQNAAATGGLRGGNVQQGLAEFGSGLFGNYYQNMLGQLGGLQQQGFNTQTNLANARMGTAGQVGQTYANMGQAQGQGILAQQAAQQQGMAGMAQGLGGISGLFGGGMFGGAASGAASGAALGPWGAAAGGVLGALGGW